ncbi:MAG: RidA family protein [Gemmatimonadota bacterium]
MRYRIINPEPLGTPRGWNHGLLTTAPGRLLFVAGQTASDADGVVRTFGLVEQFERALSKVVAVVREAGGEPADIGRLTLYVTDLEEYLGNRRALGVAYRRLMDRHYPTMALVEVKGLADEEALLEIEATAVVP